MSIEPKTLKAFIGQIKDCLDAIPISADASILAKCFYLLLASELCQRGVIISLDDIKHDNSSEDFSKLMTIINNAAGKPLLNESYTPKPLVAGAAVVSSMAAEKLADVILFSIDSVGNDDNSCMGFLSNVVSENVLKRCEDVTDDRFRVLINFGRRTFIDDNLEYGSSSVINSLDSIALLMLRISLGNQFRAASFSNPDQPPMWKRSLDLCIKLQVNMLRLKEETEFKDAKKIIRQREIIKDEDIYEAYHTADAILPLKNLVRIAESKNNSKRVSELSLRLTESYICPAGIQNYILREKGISLWNEMNSIFVADYVPKELKHESDRYNYIMKGKEALKKFDKQNTDENMKLMILHQICSIRVEIELETHIIDVVSKKRLEAANHRKGLSNQNRLDTNTLKLDVQRDLLSKSVTDDEFVTDDYDGIILEDEARKLQELVLSIDPTILSQNLSEDMQNSINQILQLHIKRLMLKAQAFSIKCYNSNKLKKSKIIQSDVNQAWNEVETFISPLINDCAKYIDGPKLSLSKMKMFKAACQAILTVKWMRQLASPPLALIDIATKYLLHHRRVLEQLSLEQVKQNIKDKEESIIETSGDEEIDSELSDLVHSIWAGRCHLYLSRQNSIMENNSSDCKEISVNAIDLSKAPKVFNSQAQYGMPFLMCLVSWSGFYNAPWSFCNATTAREIITFARNSIKANEIEWGREESYIETFILNVAEADAECGFLSGGFVGKAKLLYQDILPSVKYTGSEAIISLLHAHITQGLIKIRLCFNDDDSDSHANAVEDAKESLSTLIHLQGSNESPSSTPLSMILLDFRASLNFHLCQLRTLVAELLIRSLQFTDAEIFLKGAVSDSPSNYDAALALGAFFLRMHCIRSNESSSDNEFGKKSHIQLLKVLKLDCTNADPFSLLGIWYEMKNDTKRAIGCFSKALLIDPSHPVAGRGILRSSNDKEKNDLYRKAISLVSSTNGWAWKALGDSKALSGLDEEAILFYQQALRCRDIESSQHHTLAAFFVPPYGQSNFQECSDAWAALASSYQRLGKYSASLRAYESTRVIGIKCKNKYLCAWAQVELDLGLLDNSVLKFEQVLRDSPTTNSYYIASYGFASCKLLFANQRIEEGKYGASLQNLREGIEILSRLISMEKDFNTICVLKLLGDLYALGYKVPSSTFGKSNTSNVDEIGDFKKLEFLKEGELIYTKRLQKVEALVERIDDMSLMTASLNDVATIILLQANLYGATFQNDLVSKKCCKEEDSKVNSLLDRSIQFFRRAIQSNELDSFAWLGLGCALSSKDTLLSQHALCRALQLDKTVADAWVNLSLIYCTKNNLNASKATIDMLTQIGDTPLIWIVRGLLIECAIEKFHAGEQHQTAADAYRACLQTSRNPTALLGLGMNCRWLQPENSSSFDDYNMRSKEISQKESEASLSMYLTSCNVDSPIAQFLHDVMISERTTNTIKLLDNNALEKVLVAANSIDIPSTKNENVTTVPPTIEDSQRMVKQNPDDGGCWLQLAKALAMSVTNIKNPSDQSCELLVDVVERSKHILKTAVVEPVILHSTVSSSHAYKSMTSSPVKATQLSDAYALSYWIVNGNNKASNSHDLPRALLLDPENRFARAAINF